MVQVTLVHTCTCTRENLTESIVRTAFFALNKKGTYNTCSNYSIISSRVSFSQSSTKTAAPRSDAEELHRHESCSSRHETRDCHAWRHCPRTFQRSRNSAGASSRRREALWERDRRLVVRCRRTGERGGRRRTEWTTRSASNLEFQFACWFSWWEHIRQDCRWSAWIDCVRPKIKTQKCDKWIWGRYM